MREEKKLNLLIGKTTDWCFVFLESAFEYSDWIKGLSFNLFQFHTEEEKKQAVEDTDFLEYWQQAVGAGNTLQWYEEWKEEAKAEFDPYDDSYRDEDWLYQGVLYARNKDKEDYDEDSTECCWGGRCFCEEMLQEDYREWTNEEESALEQLREYAVLYEEL